MHKIIISIIEALQEHVQNDRGIKRIVYEDPVFIGKVDTPCIIVSPRRTIPQVATNCDDNDLITVEIGLVLDARDYCGKTDCDGRDLDVDVAKKAIEIMEERNDDFKIADNTILGVIRKNLFYIPNGLSIKNDVEGVVYRPTIKDDFPQYEALVQVTFTTDSYERA